MDSKNIMGQLVFFFVGLGVLLTLSMANRTILIVPEIGRWAGKTFITSDENLYPAMNLTFDINRDKSMMGTLVIYPTNVPENALELVVNNGCKVGLDSSVSIVFDSEKNASFDIIVASCNVKFFGDYTFNPPLIGTWHIEYDEQATYLLNNPLPVVTTPIELGYKTFIDNCSSCHSSDASGMPGIPVLTTDRIATLSDIDVMTIINNGVSQTAMPAFGVKLSQEQRDAILLLLRTPEYFNR